MNLTPTQQWLLAELVELFENRTTIELRIRLQDGGPQWVKGVPQEWTKKPPPREVARK